MQGRAFIAVSVTIITMFAGCADDGAPLTPPTTTAPPPAPTIETGTVSGLIVSEEELPVPKVEIVIKETNNSTTSDAAGAFTFNGLDPGEYTILASALRFESLARQVDVIAGEVTEVRYVLATLILKPEPYYTMIPYEGMLQCSFNPYYSIHPCGGVTGEEKDQFLLTTEATMQLEEVVLELVWTPGTPGTAASMEIDFCDAHPERQADVICVQNNYYEYRTSASPNIMRLDDVPIDEYNEWLVAAGSGFVEPTFSLQQRFTIYVTLCILEKCADDYTAIPPA